MKSLIDFAEREPRILPVILLLDNSGSMYENDNIGTMNRAVNEMIRSFQSRESFATKISVSIISFGGDGAKLVQELTDVKDVKPINLVAGGVTSLGGAMTIAKGMIEDCDIVTNKSYRPIVVLVTDGMPNDDWERALKDFKSTGRSSKCTRMAMGIGVEKNSLEYSLLEGFVSDNEQVFCAADASDIRKFFKYIKFITEPVVNVDGFEDDYEDDDDDEYWKY